MKKIKNMRGMFDGLRGLGGSSQSSKSDTESFDFEENLKSEDFKIAKIVCHGFPNAPCCIAFDPIQKLLAIGTKHGSIRILGHSGVDCNLSLDKEAVKQLIFIINEGGLISIASDNTISLWTIRQKEPTISMQTQFNKREDISHAYLPFQSKFIYIGTTQGNVYILNIETFKLSGFDIRWNKAIGMMDSQHPGSVVHLSECPSDQSRLLIGFRKGIAVLWDLQKHDGVRFRHTEDLCSIAWHWEGRAFICSHVDGSLVKWLLKSPQKPAELFFPRANLAEADSGAASAAAYRPINRVCWLSRKQDKAELLLFSGGGPQDLPQPCLNIQAARHIDVLMMEHGIVDIVPLCETPFSNDSSEAYAVAVLLQNDLVVIDLLSDGYPNFENPYPMDLHESPVTSCHFVADCPHKLIENCFLVGRSQKQAKGFSEHSWPVTGGKWGDSKTSYSEVLITGHADGSVKFWNASLLQLQALYRLKTSKYFDTGSPATVSSQSSVTAPPSFRAPPSRQVSTDIEGSAATASTATADDSGGATPSASSPAAGPSGPSSKILPPSLQDESPHAIQLISLMPDGQRLLLGTSTYACVLAFNRREISSEIMTVDLCIEPNLEESGGGEAHEDNSAQHQRASSGSQQNIGSWGSPKHPAERELWVTQAVKRGRRRWSPGYQPELICRLATACPDCQPAPIITAKYSAEFQILAIGNENGVGLVDTVQGSPLMTLCTPDLHGSVDTHVRNLRSPTGGKKDDRLQGSEQSTAIIQHSRALASIDSNHDATSSGTVAQNHSDTATSPVPAVAAAATAAAVEASSPGSQSIVRLRKPTACGIRTYRLLQSTESCAKFNESQRHGELTESDGHVTEHSDSKEVALTGPNRVDDDDDYVNIESISPTISEEQPKHEQYQRSEPASNATTPPGFPVSSSVTSLPSASDDAVSGSNHSVTPKPSAPPPPPPPRPPPPQPRRPGSLVSCETNFAELSASATNADPPPRSHLLAKRLTAPSIQPLTVTPTVQQQQQHQPQQQQQQQLPCQLWDLRDDSLPCKRLRPVPLTAANAVLCGDKSDNFSRSCSSSTSSLEHCNKEAVVLLQFGLAQLRKTDPNPTPTLWIGTSHGSLFPVRLQLPPTEAARAVQAAAAAPSGTLIRMLGAMQAVSLLNSPPPAAEDTQLVSLCSDKQVRILSLPSLTCCAKKKLTETSSVAKAAVTMVRGHACLVCLLANGHIVVNSLPGLKPLMDVDYAPSVDVRFGRTFQCSNHGHAVYFCSPSEVQKITICSDMCNDLNDMLADLYTPCDLPEPPKKSLFEKFNQNLFGSASTPPIDREQIFGEAAAGKPMSGICTVKQGPQQNMEALRARASGANSEIANALQKGLERGEKLGEVDEQTERMRQAALEYRNLASQLAQKQKDKKFWQF